VPTIPGVGPRCRPPHSGGARCRDRHRSLALSQRRASGLLGRNVSWQCRERWSTPQWADTPRQPLAAAHTG
jgi:hypothetical protein